MELIINNKEIFELRKELDIYKDYKDKLFNRLAKLKSSNDAEGIKKLLKDKNEEEWKKYYDDYINKIEEKIKTIQNQNEKLITEKNLYSLDRKTKERFLKDINVDTFVLKKITRNKKEIKTEEPAYTVYKQTKYGGYANYFFENLTFYLIKKYPEIYDNLMHLIRVADIRILSKTYVSVMIMTSFLSLLSSFFLYSFYTLLFSKNILLGLVKAVPISFLVFLVTPVLFYFYPYILIGNRRKAIKNDLPFVIIHMAAIAGSGAPPVSIFSLIINSGEYKGLEAEIKKIVNYVNLFGYDLPTALRTVSMTTPSPAFKDLLTGLTATTETGGDLKSYLKGKAEDALNTYRLDIKKYVESLAIYSDIYTAILIAAPLLFMTTLAIINVIGGNIGGVSVKTISIIGIYFMIPLLNIGFLVFLSLIQPET